MPPKTRRNVLIGIAAVLVLAIAFWWLRSGAPAEAAPPPPTVTVATPLVRAISEWDDYAGRFSASKSVEVRPRVSGAITGVHFTDGAVVRKGQLLFTIDARPYSAALAEARAAVASARSELNLAQTNYGRATRLLAADAVSQSDVDRLRAEVQAASAALAAANARVQSRALDVGFTQVRAPISGRISDRRIDAGNLVLGGNGGGEATLLTTINAVDPIYFDFDASESLYLKARRANESGAQPSAVDIRLQDEGDYRWHGRLDFVDNGLDQRSGTIRLRAVVSNPTQFLMPGLFGNMRLSSGQTAQAMLVPDAAISTDQSRKIVMVVAKDGSVTPRPVELGPLVDGLRVIRSGISPKERIIISGAQMAMPGVKVQHKVGRITPDPAARAAATSPSPPSGEATFAGR
ncbi:efflux RND transporter periplasmic adaptor subunit [Sphingomonas sabuli]|uniref:Efflux RND transporter periplasmic adaptor subunit n=1 Tax=Sphingomonas sabuli TaxID=2764186 RepID=A0A7G9L640_9SPHN|nr:efflux RND transporter periplasmic adaptor subunit [Sphingomonas sabuli]QNM84089.1 efflux RND transporter periplasmic adaptor subunit [Sphingomonas sabuli]